MPSPLLDRVKIQAEVLVPVLRAFREELGVDRANRIAWKALAAWREQIARDRHAGIAGSGADRWMKGIVASQETIGDAIDVDMLRMEPTAIDFDVTGCRFAEFFRALGEPELGFAMLCSMDDTTAEQIGEGEVDLSRAGTIMQGAARCDFRYALKRGGGG
ncbi:MAG TPA: L-2-amino-thiazoline-4-carboxylic acid hydrolase [Candidatus Binatia bacterium]|nr:L-2-amino-thiazoline-4-carboxylic acid hydrolase [Candidatus Binatia bacterium]